MKYEITEEELVALLNQLAEKVIESNNDYAMSYQAISKAADREVNEFLNVIELPFKKV